MVRALPSPSLLRRVIDVDRLEWHVSGVCIFGEASVLGFADALAVCMRFPSLTRCLLIVAFTGRAICI
jgi:hypothetical protein